MAFGKIEALNNETFGRIARSGESAIRLNREDLQDATWDRSLVGRRVEFDSGIDERGIRALAKNVRLVEE